MTKDEARRAVLLCEALEGLDGLAKGLSRIEPAPGYGRRAMVVDIRDLCDAESEVEGRIELDLETGAHLIHWLRDYIGVELCRLGVEA